jgi:glutathione synthase/RimK-type ligase-like ATP-grasp enzyme
VPKGYATRKHKEIVGLLNKGRRLYLKVNFGAMGKGITRLDKNKWVTNFIYRMGCIVSRKGDYNWKFRDITGNKGFLIRLLRKELVIEEEIDPYILENKKFDIRYYIVYGKIKHMIIRSAPVENPVTNITQGGEKEKRGFLKTIPKKYLVKAERNAIKAAKALNLNLAGIDVMFSKKRIPYVMEAQSFPGFPQRKYNFSGKILREILKNW